MSERRTGPFAPAKESAGDTLRAAIDQVRNAIETGRRPGMPLSILSNIAREAPLGSLLCAFLLGVAVGRTVPVALLAGMLAALLPSAVLVFRHGAAARKMGIPFAPFLALGGVVALFAGDTIVDWYLTYL